jgi:hypothetical protein
MPRPPVILDLQVALAERAFPTVSVWNRLEGRPRTTEFDRALRAEIRDPLWMLARQWQLGEFRGEDAGSPVTATFHVRTTSPTRYQAMDSPPTSLPDRQPLETLVEGRAVPFAIGPDLVSLDLRLMMGRRWMKLMSPHPPPMRAKIIGRWPVSAPDPAADSDVPLLAHPDVWATLQAVAGRVMDGYELYAHLKAGGHPYDGVSVSPHEQQLLDALVPRFVSWFEDLIAQPSGPEAFDPTRLEHRFAVAAPETTGPETVLAATEFPGGMLDWHAFSYDTSGTALGTSGGPATAATTTRTVVPGEVRFSGMPNPRWWAFEDGQTDFGAVTADTTDLVKLLFLEFALVYSNDWFLLPCDLDAGTLARVDGVMITDVFGQRNWIEPAGSGADDDWQRWSMYNLDVGDAAPDGTGRAGAPGAVQLGLFLPPGVPGTAGGPPAEDVLLVRDEAANMVWGIERAVRLATGASLPGEEAARETLAYRLRLHPPPAPLTPIAAIAYQAMNTVPENWIPFIPVHVPGDNREIQLQRGAMPRVLDGEASPPEKVRPRTTLLSPGLDAGQPYFVHEEEVPRAGTRLTVAFSRARWYDGRVVVWLGARRATDRGEASSGLDWDRIVTTP